MLHDAFVLLAGLLLQPCGACCVSIALVVHHAASLLTHVQLGSEPLGLAISTHSACLHPAHE